MEAGRRILPDRGDIRLLGASSRSHAMCRCGRVSFQWRRSSVGAQAPQEDAGLTILPS